MNDEIRRTYYQTLARQHQAATEGQLLGWNREVIEARLQLTEDAWNGLMREHVEMIKQSRTAEEKEINDLFMVRAEAKYMEVKVLLLRGINEDKSRSFLDRIEQRNDDSGSNDNNDDNEEDYNKIDRRRQGHSRWGPLSASRDGSSTSTYERNSPSINNTANRDGSSSSTYGRNIDLNTVKQEHSDENFGEPSGRSSSQRLHRSPDTDSWDKDDIFKDGLPQGPAKAGKSNKYIDLNDEHSSGVRRSYPSDEDEDNESLLHNDGGRRTRPWKPNPGNRGEGPKRTRYSSPPPSPPNNKKFIQCVVCQRLHPLFRCQKFLNMPLNARQTVVRMNELCRSCLSKGHYVNTCKQTCCKRCPTKMHNSTLCPKCPKEIARFKRYS